jgi:hypothetical protein
VDNASADGSVELLRADYPWVRVIETGANLGFAGGNNAALRTFTTPYAVLLNNDAIPEPSWLRRTLDACGEGVVVTPKIVFLPRFVRLTLSTEGFVPGGADPRELGVRIHGVAVDGGPSRPLWERLTYGDEGGYTWTRPSGEWLLPRGRSVTLTWAAERDKDVTIGWPGGSAVLRVTAAGGEATFTLPEDVETVDVVNNVGGIVTTLGYGADRGFQEADEGQYDKPEDVFTFCGNGAAFPRAVIEKVGVFDDDFFLYYEDTDLSWRIRAAGYDIRYEPTAVLRHHHSASSGEASYVFRFHVDRNRLLMLTKNATWGLALPQILRYPVTTASIAVRAVRTRNRAALADTKRRLRVIASYLRLLPRMLARRRAIERVVSRRALERRWLVEHR